MARMIHRLLAGAAARGVLLACCAGLASLGSLAQAQPAVARRVYPDEAVGAKDALVRAQELAAGGNLAEAVRVLQRTMDSEGEQLLPTSEDADLYVPVRRIVHGMLLEDRALLDRYRLAHEASARAMLESGQERAVEQRFLLTASGFEAALRLAQTELESGRFETTRLLLEELEPHPDGTGEGASGAADLAELVGVYLAREDVTALARRWREKAGTKRDRPVPEQGAGRSALGAASLQAFDAPEWRSVPRDPLQTVTWDLTPTREEQQFAANMGGRSAVSGEDVWVAPAVLGPAVYVNDGRSISALDAATLTRLWRTTPSEPGITRRSADDYFYYGQTNRSREDVAGVAVRDGVVVACTGQPVAGQRLGDGRVHGVRASDGAMMWSQDATLTDKRLEGAAVRGPAVIEEGRAVVALRIPGLARRITTLYLMGLDLHSGERVWLRAVGSVGTQPWGKLQKSVDGTSVERGIVYRADEMGVLGAYEAAGGRPLWVRLSPPFATQEALTPTPMDQNAQPSEVNAPIVVGENLYVLEAARGAVTCVRASDGALIGRREDPALAGALYALRVGDWLAAVSRKGVAFLAIDDFAKGEWSSTGDLAEGALRGRAVAAGEKLLVCAGEAVAEVDPAQARSIVRHELSRTGNLIVAGGDAGGEGGHLLVADARGLHSFLSWERAEAGLKRRIAESPGDPAPVLTYVELALRVGQAHLAPALIGRAAALIEADPGSAVMSVARGRLFGVLSDIISSSRRAMLTGAGSEPTPGTVRDPAVLDALAAGLWRVAEEPQERTQALLERAFVRNIQDRTREAVDALQEVLADPSLAMLSVAEVPGGWASDGMETAADAATSELTRLLEVTGPEPYAAYEEEAQRTLGQLGQDAGPEELATIAQRYPLSSSAPMAWARAGERWESAGDSVSARRALGRGLRAAIENARCGRLGLEVVAGELAGALFALSKGTASMEVSYRAMLSLSAQMPSVRVRVDGAETPAGQAAALAREEWIRRSGLTRVGTRAVGRTQTLEGWEPVPAVVASRPECSGSCVVMVSRRQSKTALFAASPGDGRLEQVWTRGFETAPVVVRVTPEDTLLFTPQAGAASFEMISNVSGRTIWTSPALTTLPGWEERPAPVRGPRPPGTAGENISTPLDGVVRADDLIFVVDEHALAISDRRGHMAVFNLGDGSVRWSARTVLRSVFDIDQTAEDLVLVGTRAPEEDGGAIETPAVLTLTKASGQVVWQAPRDAMGDHARWARGLSDGGAVVGAADAVLRLGKDGSVVWRATGAGMRASAAAWMVGESIFVLDPEFDLWRVTLADGSKDPEAIDGQRRINLPFNVLTTDEHLGVSSSMGVVVFGADGRVVGLDALEAGGRLEPAVIGEHVFVTIESGGRAQGGNEEVLNAARLLVLESPTGRVIGESPLILFEPPKSLLIMDNKALVVQSTHTLVVEMPEGK